METFTPVRINEYFLKLITSGLSKEIYQTMFKPIFEILNDNTVYNAKSALSEALNAGRVYYENGAFKATKNFSNAVAKELESMGAKYRNGAYYLAQSMLPLEIESIIATVAAREAAKMLALNTLFAKLIQDVGKDTAVAMFIEKAVENLFTKLQNDLDESTNTKRVPLIEIGKNESQAKKIAKDYVYNMDFWVKKWKTKELFKMREDIAKMVQKGVRFQTVQDYLMNRWGIAERKAAFLARNESGIAQSVLKATHYQDMGCTHFAWLKSVSIEKRELHLEYAKETGNQYGIGGTNIFAFDNPPIIEQIKTQNGSFVPKPNGQRGLPMQTYNCQCDLVGVKDIEYYINRNKIENAKRNIFTKIAYAVKNCTQRNHNTWRYRRFGEG